MPLRLFIIQRNVIFGQKWAMRKFNVWEWGHRSEKMDRNICGFLQNKKQCLIQNYFRFCIVLSAVLLYTIEMPTQTNMWSMSCIIWFIECKTQFFSISSNVYFVLVFFLFYEVNHKAIFCTSFLRTRALILHFYHRLLLLWYMTAIRYNTT